LEVTAAIGLAVGLAVPVLGIAAAVGLSLLMAGAIGAHARTEDLRHAAPAALLLMLVVVTAVLRFTSM
jgi:F0F1-type ATP synthase membrane subunit c/vacuolar-type H+-ATPase subunit K